MPADAAGAGADAGRGGALRDLVTAGCEALPTAHNQPLTLDDPDVAWFVERGALDVFVVEHRDGLAESSFTHVVHAAAGRLVFGAAPEAGLALVARGLPASVVRRVPLRALAGGQPEDAGAPAAGPVAAEVVRQADRWVAELAAVVAGHIEVRPAPDARLAAGGSRPVAGTVTADRGVVWLAGTQAQAAFLGSEWSRPDGPGLLPLTPSTWVDVPGPADAAVKSSAELAQDIGLDGLLRTALPEFHRLALGSLDFNRRALLADAVNLQRESSAWRRRHEHRARSGLYATTREQEHPETLTPLAAALHAVASHERVPLHVPEADPRRDEPPALQEVLDFSGLRRRRVRLAAGDRWWLGDSGAMLAFGRGDGRPVALLPGVGGRYRARDPAAHAAKKLGRQAARDFEEHAWQIYPRMAGAAPGASGLRELFGVAAGGLQADAGRLVVTGLLAGLLTLAPTIAIGALIEWVIPAGTVGPLVSFALVLVGLAFIAALAHVLRGTAIMRFEGRAAARIGAALIDRVLRVRPGAFKGFSTGELGMRVAAFQQLRDRVAGRAASSLLSVMFLLPAFVVVFFYSTLLGWLVLALGALALAAAAALAAAQVGSHRRHFRASRQVASSVVQFIASIGKLRGARAEAAAFAAWARLYREQKRAEVRVERLTEHAAALGAALPVLAAAAVFGVVVFSGPDRLPVADTLVVFAVATMFFRAIAELGNEFEAITTVAASCDEVRPILAAEVESAPGGAAAVRLGGALSFDRVSFRYDENGPDILRDVTIHAAPGEFIAIVGESGAGKSTLVKLALGLEEPSSGGVYYDERNLARLDRGAVRRQIGVVTQEAELQPGPIVTNIVGATHELTTEDAWRAARLAAVDADIAAMPMGMDTPVSENGTTLSGGQRQRLALAAALVREPRIVILDEATSWLDSVTQDDIMARIEATAVTRVVVAHRLSTTRNANRIYVLQAGRVVQEGTFEALSATEGPFMELIRRQMA